MKTIRATITRHIYSTWRRTGNLKVKIGDSEIHYSYDANTFVKKIDHFTVVAKLPGLRMEARLPVTLL